MMAVGQVYRLVCLVILSVISLSSIAKGDDRPLLYQVSFNGKTAYLFGSIHIGKADFYPLPAVVEEAFSQASGLVVEAKPDNHRIPQLMKKYGRQQYPSDKETQALLVKYCEDKQDFCHQIATFSPWVQAMQISLARFSLMGLSAQFGVDMTLMEKNGNRPLYELESTEEQLGLLASFSPNIQWQMLQESINTSDEEMLLLVDAWRQGNTALLIELIEGQLIELSVNKNERVTTKRSIDDLDSESSDLPLSENNSILVNRLLWQRNQTMALGIKQLLNNKDIDNLFVVVGVGHLVGNKNIQNVLLKQGVTIKNCWQQQCFGAAH
ncbi:TraB/GumN family protein [Shewanella surugensis]|uniref:TraB/GumN family protein n=1 Tax=Shewanella surugensis TaxID=212020 RepID=A0ABT0LAU4_9GAMM|nr:TraB/GumN family protein [Shewanella surugensis]MCL1124817.1 TraB/GumN family protein [Shewanella surugensis]